MGKKPVSSVLTREVLQKSGIYTSFDMAKWCTRKGLNPLFVDLSSRRVMRSNLADSFLWSSASAWDVSNITSPIIKYTNKPGLSIWYARGAVEAWLADRFEIDLTFLPALGGAFSSVGVEQLKEDVEIASRFEALHLTPTKYAPTIMELESKVKSSTIKWAPTTFKSKVSV